VPRVSGSILEAFYGATMAYRPDYAALHVPVQAFFADQYPDGLVGPNTPDTVRRKVEAWHEELWRPWQEAAIGRFRESAPDAEVVFLTSASHAALPFEARDTIGGNLNAH